ncbi:MAG: hypothetical protein WBA16_05970 [Nonlabens sp.]
MKSLPIKLKYLLPILCLLLVACPSNDDETLPAVVPPVAGNEFTVGNTAYALSQGFRSPTRLDGPGPEYVTFIALTGNGFTVNDQRELQGRGDLLFMEIYTNTAVLSPGIYDIGPAASIGEVYLAYETDYDPNFPFNARQFIVDGMLDIQVDPAGIYTITTTGSDNATGSAFTASFTGLLPTVL